MIELVAGTAAPQTSASAVYVIDDDRDIRSSLVLLLRASGLAARAFGRGEDFLDELDFLQPGCVLLDLRMPEMSGLELLAELRRRDCHWPVVVITGHGDISLAVRAVKLGAIEFLEKPFGEDELKTALGEAFRRLEEAALKSKHSRAARQALDRLTTRERQVFEGVVRGQTSKEIASNLSLSPRTVESYRLTMMRKLKAQSMYDLLAIATHGVPAQA
ncbi:MAG TPA: response regulator [Sphingomonas sp.]|nr:response regulator [Sphingomonas sp.]